MILLIDNWYINLLISSFFLGVVRTTRRIDYEENNSLNFTVVAYDSGAPPLSSTADIMVNVININDMDPVFSQVSFTFVQ